MPSITQRSSTLLVAFALVASAVLFVAPTAAAASKCDGLPITIIGTSGNDTIEGTSGDDVIHGLGGNDLISGGGGHDVICGGPGADVISGGPGGDVLKGGAGSDELRGNSGKDRLVGGTGDDFLHGNNQADKANGGDGWDVCLSAKRVDPCEGPESLTEFTGDPASPIPVKNGTEVTVSVNSREAKTRNRLAAMQGQHGNDCGPPPATHKVTKYPDAVYQCRSHMMTAISSGSKKLQNYAVAMFSPNQILDFTGGEATIRFDVSTARSSARDWFDVWITPFEHLQRIPVQEGRPSMQGPPKDGVLVSLKAFTLKGSPDVRIVDNFKVTEIDGPVEWVGYESFLTPSSTVRSTFEIRLSKNHITVGMPDVPFYWVSEPIPGGLDFTKGIVQFGHNSYNVFDCDECDAPNTWHWDNIYLAPAEPITALPANRRVVKPGTPSFVTFDEQAPAASFVQFTGIGHDLQVSFDNGATWVDAKTQHKREIHTWRFKNYHMKVPKGTKRVDFRGDDLHNRPWQVQDVSILSLDLPESAGNAAQYQPPADPLQSSRASSTPVGVMPAGLALPGREG